MRKKQEKAKAKIYPKKLTITNEKKEKKGSNKDNKISEIMKLLNLETSEKVNDSKKGKLAITHYSVIKSSKNYSLLQVFIDTGRKNQIRVHMNVIGTSILGDKKYGGNKAKRLYLHSNILEFIHPVTGKNICINCNSNFDIL